MRLEPAFTSSLALLLAAVAALDALAAAALAPAAAFAAVALALTAAKSFASFALFPGLNELIVATKPVADDFARLDAIEALLETAV